MQYVFSKCFPKGFSILFNKDNHKDDHLAKKKDALKFDENKNLKFLPLLYQEQ
jgi:hypothetical protein